MSQAALLDTSVLIASESGRPIDRSALPEQTFVSVITIAELQLGVLAATDTQTRSRRLATLNALGTVDPLVIDADVAARWADLRMRLADANRRMNINDLWIAAVAVANDLPIATQDSDFMALEEIGAARIIRL